LHVTNSHSSAAVGAAEIAVSFVTSRFNVGLNFGEKLLQLLVVRNERAPFFKPFTKPPALNTPYKHEKPMVQDQTQRKAHDYKRPYNPLSRMLTGRLWRTSQAETVLRKAAYAGKA
jgi:hypothetical protein